MDCFLKYKKILVIVPHWDDEVLIAGGTLHKAKENNIETVILSLDKSNQGLAKQVGQDLMGYKSIQTIDEVKDVVKYLNGVDLIITTHPMDILSDHARMYRQLADALWFYNLEYNNGLPTILLGGCGVLCPDKKDHVVVELDLVDVQAKQDALEIYDTYPNPPNLKRNFRDVVKEDNWVEGEALLLGHRHGLFHAETFEMAYGGSKCYLNFSALQE